MTKLCFIISPGKSDILEYYGCRVSGAHICYAVQPDPWGLCDAIFRAAPFIEPEEDVIVGLPDTIWYPSDAMRTLEDGVFSFLLFPVSRPELYDAVLTDDNGAVREVQVKRQGATSEWIWGAFKFPGKTLHALQQLWEQRQRRDEYFGTLVNAFLERGGQAKGVRSGQSYSDVGTLQGYREAVRLIEEETRKGQGTTAAVVT